MTEELTLEKLLEVIETKSHWYFHRLDIEIPKLSDYSLEIARDLVKPKALEVLKWYAEKEE